MSQEFYSHPVIKNYEASRQGEVRHCKSKKFVGCINNVGYLRFSYQENGVKKCYLIHRFVMEAVSGSLIPTGLVINHKNSNPLDNNFYNLEVVSQRENCKRGNTGGPRIRKAVSSYSLENQKLESFTSTYQAGRHYGINRCHIYIKSLTK